MKKLLLFLLPLIALSAHAQGRHEVSFFLGGPTTEVSDSPRYSYSGTTELYNMYEPRTYAGDGINFGVDYTYTVFRWLKVGLQADLSSVWYRTYYPTIERADYVGYDTNTFYAAAIMPEAKFFCMTRRIVKLYGKVAAGVRYAFSDVKDSPVAFAYELVPIGIQLGGQIIYFTSEISIGSEISGIRIGCGYRF